jgi:hypothetical protein
MCRLSIHIVFAIFGVLKQRPKTLICQVYAGPQLIKKVTVAEKQKMQYVKNK